MNQNPSRMTWIFFVMLLVIIEAKYHAKRSMIGIDKKIIDSRLSMV